jgi:hypothetical protein
MKTAFYAIPIGKIILCLMLPSLLVDSITGWMLMNSPIKISFSQIYRSGMFAVMFAWLIFFWFRGFMFLFSLLTILLMLMVWHTVSMANHSELVEDLRFNLSLFAHFFYYLFLIGYVRRIKNNLPELLQLEKTILRIIWFSFFTIACNIILGSFGFGFSTYASYTQGGESSAGWKGYFVAGNDLSSVFLLVASIILLRVWPRWKLKNYLIISVAILILAVMLLTKTVIIGALLLIIGIPVSMTGVISKWSFNPRPLIPFFSGLLFGVVAIMWLMSSDSAIVRRTVSLIEEGGFFAAIISGRSSFFSTAMDVLVNNYNYVDWLLGFGWVGFMEAMGKILGYQKIVEIDYIDIFMVNGLVGLVLVIVVWSWYLRSSILLIFKVPIARAVLFVDILLLCLAGTSGHVLYSAMNGMFIALLNVLPIIKNEQLVKN